MLFVQRVRFARQSSAPDMHFQSTWRRIKSTFAMPVAKMNPVHWNAADLDVLRMVCVAVCDVLQLHETPTKGGTSCDICMLLKLG